MWKKCVLPIVISFVAACGPTEQDKARKSCEEHHEVFCTQYVDCVIERGVSEDLRQKWMDTCLESLAERSSCDDVVEVVGDVGECEADTAEQTCNEFLDNDVPPPSSCVGLFLTE